jgi:hypothetical protein
MFRFQKMQETSGLAENQSASQEGLHGVSKYLSVIHRLQFYKWLTGRNKAFALSAVSNSLTVHYSSNNENTTRRQHSSDFFNANVGELQMITVNVQVIHPQAAHRKMFETHKSDKGQTKYHFGD